MNPSLQLPPMEEGGIALGTLGGRCPFGLAVAYLSSAFTAELFSLYFRVTAIERHEEFPAASKALTTIVLKPTPSGTVAVH
jgi:hypothetical protein